MSLPGTHRPRRSPAPSCCRSAGGAGEPLERGECAGERLVRRAGGIDALPVQRAEVVALLGAGDRGVGIGGIAATRAHARDPGGEVGVKEESVEGHAQGVGRALHHRPFLRFCKHAVDDGAVPGSGRAAGLVGDAGIDARRDSRRIGVRGQFFLFVLAEQRLALDVRAQHHGARRGPEVGRQRARQRRFAGSGEPADGNQARRWRFDQLPRNVEILARDACDRVFLLGRRRLQPRRRDLGADGRAHRQIEREGCEPIEVLSTPGGDEIAVEHDVRGGPQPALGQIHQQECQIVEHVARRDQRAEFDGIEQHRPALEQDDIAEMEIAVDAADEASRALEQERMNAGIGRSARAREGVDALGRKQIGRLDKGRDVLVDVICQRFHPGTGIDCGRRRVRRRHGSAERIGQCRVDPAGLSQVVEGRPLVETAHLDSPFHRRAGAVEREPAVRLARDRHDATIDFRRERAVDLKLGLAGLLAQVEGRIVEERKAHRAFDLEGAGAGQEYRGGMSVDALDRRSAMGRRFGQQGENRFLRFALVHPCRNSSNRISQRRFCWHRAMSTPARPEPFTARCAARSRHPAPSGEIGMQASSPGHDGIPHRLL